MRKYVFTFLLIIFSTEALSTQILFPNKDIQEITPLKKNGATYCANEKVLDNKSYIGNERYINYWIIKSSYHQSLTSINFNIKVFNENWELLHKQLVEHPEVTMIESRDNSTIWKTDDITRRTLIGFVVKLIHLKERIPMINCSYKVINDYLDKNMDTPKELLTTYNEKVKKYNSIFNACVKPNIKGFTSNPDALAYAECLQNNRPIYNKTLKELKKLDSILVIFQPDLKRLGMLNDVMDFEYSKFK